MVDLASRSELIDQIEDLFLILEKWETHFGAGFRATWDSAQFADQGRMETIAALVETAKSRLNGRDPGRFGEASLLLRDAREDRLLLRYSTSPNLLRGRANDNQVKDVASYFDSAVGSYYYPLFDKLVEPSERSSLKAREARGLTGWVAVSGHHLLVNGEYGKHGLPALDEERPETQGECQTYGCPIWGHHVSEAPRDSSRPKRFIAVPVKSTADPKRTVGVLRYACSSRGKEISGADLSLLGGIAALISAALGVDATATRALRWSRMGEQKDRLRREYSFTEFLEFLAKSLGSSIASVYLDVGGIVGSGSRLRLVDAFGISAPVADLRDSLQDYLPQEAGFTRWLYDQGPRNPSVVDSVHAHKSWKGKNTIAFYGEVFRPLMEGAGKTRGQPTDVARRYEIKIIGAPLFFEQERIGVLKVELPTSFDDSKHYQEEDQRFFADCAVTLGEVLGDFLSFLRGGWFGSMPRVHELVNIARMTTAVLRTRLVSPGDAKEFWTDLNEFVKSNEEQVADEVWQFLTRLPQNQAEAVQESKPWLASFAKDVVTEAIAKLLVEAMQRV